MGDKIQKAFENWKKHLKDNRIQAICKPCWEINYCPYGVMVEEFPLTEDEYYKCKVFGHECPVYSIAEPLTETKKMRTISRNISREVQFKVFRRDNQVCQMCGRNVPFDKINFDHIIPWSKGGSSDENNIRLLCGECNKSRNNNFEEEYLKASLHEHYADLIEISVDMLHDLLKMVLLWVTLVRNKQDITEEVFCRIIKSGDDNIDKFMYTLTSQIMTLLESSPPFNRVKKKLNILQFRWACYDGLRHSIEETILKYKVDKKYYIDAELYLLRMVGIKINEKLTSSDGYMRVKVLPLVE